MIDKHELRLLNWVKNKETGKFHRIIRLDEYSSPLDRIDPIELTEDILLKCGFVKQDNNSYQFDSDLGFTLWSKNGSTVNLYYGSDVFGQDIKTLHYLQNAFFFITGKELQIDLK